MATNLRPGFYHLHTEQDVGTLYLYSAPQDGSTRWSGTRGGNTPDGGWGDTVYYLTGSEEDGWHWYTALGNREIWHGTSRPTFSDSIGFESIAAAGDTFEMGKEDGTADKFAAHIQFKAHRGEYGIISIGDANDLHWYPYGATTLYRFHFTPLAASRMPSPISDGIYRIKNAAGRYLGTDTTAAGTDSVPHWLRVVHDATGAVRIINPQNGQTMDLARGEAVGDTDAGRLSDKTRGLGGTYSDAINHLWTISHPASFGAGQYAIGTPGIEYDAMRSWQGTRRYRVFLMGWDDTANTHWPSLDSDPADEAPRLRWTFESFDKSNKYMGGTYRLYNKAAGGYLTAAGTFSETKADAAQVTVGAVVEDAQYGATVTISGLPGTMTGGEYHLTYLNPGQSDKDSDTTALIWTKDWTQYVGMTGTETAASYGVQDFESFDAMDAIGAAMPWTLEVVSKSVTIPDGTYQWGATTSVAFPGVFTFAPGRGSGTAVAYANPLESFYWRGDIGAAEYRWQGYGQDGGASTGYLAGLALVGSQRGASSVTLEDHGYGTTNKMTSAAAGDKIVAVKIDGQYLTFNPTARRFALGADPYPIIMHAVDEATIPTNYGGTTIQQTDGTAKSNRWLWADYFDDAMPAIRQPDKWTAMEYVVETVDAGDAWGVEGAMRIRRTDDGAYLVRKVDTGLVSQSAKMLAYASADDADEARKEGRDLWQCTRLVRYPNRTGAAAGVEWCYIAEPHGQRQVGINGDGGANLVYWADTDATKGWGLQIGLGADNRWDPRGETLVHNAKDSTLVIGTKDGQIDKNQPLTLRTLVLGTASDAWIIRTDASSLTTVQTHVLSRHGYWTQDLSGNDWLYVNREADWQNRYILRHEGGGRFSFRAYSQPWQALTAASLAAGALLSWTDYTGADTQLWTLAQDGTSQTNPYKLRTYNDKSMALGVPADANGNGLDIAAVPVRDASNATTAMVETDDDYHRRHTFLHSGRSMDDGGHGQADNGGRVWQWNYDAASVFQGWDYSAPGDTLNQTYQGHDYAVDRVANVGGDGRTVKYIDSAAGGGQLADAAKMWEARTDDGRIYQWYMRTPANYYSNTLPLPTAIQLVNKLTGETVKDTTKTDGAFDVTWAGSSDAYCLAVDYRLRYEGGVATEWQQLDRPDKFNTATGGHNYVPGWSRAWVPDCYPAQDANGRLRANETISVPGSIGANGVVAKDIRVRLRSFAYLDGIVNRFDQVPSWGPVAVATFSVVAAPRMDVTGLEVSTDGLRIGYRLDGVASSASISVDAITGTKMVPDLDVDWREYDAPQAGTLAIPWGNIGGALPYATNATDWPNNLIDGIKYTITTTDGEATSGVFSRSGTAAVWTLAQGVTLGSESVTEAQEGTATVIIPPAGSSLRYWYEVDLGGGTRLAPAHETTDGTLLAYPQRRQAPDARTWKEDKRRSDMAQGYATIAPRTRMAFAVAEDGTWQVLATDAKEAADGLPVSGIYEIDTEDDDGHPLAVQILGNVSNAESVALDNDSNHAEGSDYTDVTYYGGRSRSLSLTGYLVDAGTGIKDLGETWQEADMLERHPRGIYRTPTGRWHAVAITSVDYGRDAARGGKITVKMEEVDPREL